MNKRGSNGYVYKWKGLTPFVKTSILTVIALMFFGLWIIEKTKTPIVSPCPDPECNIRVYAAEKKMTVDEMVEYYANKFGKYPWEKLTIKAKLHYLLLRESAYWNTKTCGDNGLACGPLQFHETTYQSFRQLMVTQKLTNKIGSRLDMEDAIETTAWAIANGRGNNWGPIARGEIKL